MTNAEARFNKSLRPRKPEGSLGRTAQDIHLDSHTAPELCKNNRAAWLNLKSLFLGSLSVACFSIKSLQDVPGDFWTKINASQGKLHWETIHSHASLLSLERVTGFQFDFVQLLQDIFQRLGVRTQLNLPDWHSHYMKTTVKFCHYMKTVTLKHSILISRVSATRLVFRSSWREGAHNQTKHIQAPTSVYKQPHLKD